MHQEYTINEHNLERQRLLAQNLQPLTERALQLVDAPPGNLRILDIACGIGETTRLLATYFSGSMVTGADIDDALVQTAKAMTKPVAAGVSFITADATNLPFADNSFDIVFGRYLLMHVPDPLAILQEMKRVCRPGGIVFSQEPDISSSTCYPHSWAYDKIVEYFNALFVDGLIGRKLPAYFTQAGLRNMQHKTDVTFELHSNSLRRMYTLTGQALEGALIAKQLATKEEHRAWVNELKRVESDDSTIHLTHPVVAVWGVK
ncbi:MAG TPA: methyltransferase domain-containing protein [Chitinophagaceae bacterium]|nr:methyltransferase domain-containing protein [Chitinophagaceae bacterium]